MEENGNYNDDTYNGQRLQGIVSRNNRRSGYGGETLFLVTLAGSVATAGVTAVVTKDLVTKEVKRRILTYIDPRKYVNNFFEDVLGEKEEVKVTKKPTAPVSKAKPAATTGGFFDFFTKNFGSKPQIISSIKKRNVIRVVPPGFGSMAKHTVAKKKIAVKPTPERVVDRSSQREPLITTLPLAERAPIIHEDMEEEAETVFLDNSLPSTVPLAPSVRPDNPNSTPLGSFPEFGPPNQYRVPTSQERFAFRNFIYKEFSREPTSEETFKFESSVTNDTPFWANLLTGTFNSAVWWSF